MEVKIKQVDVTNLKAVSNFTAFFDGKSAHVTGVNGSGKSTVIRSLTDRLRGLKPDVITKIGESEGKTVIELTDGCKFVWEYNNEGKDKLSYFAPGDFKPARREVFKSMCDQYFPNQFDINKFLTTTEPQKRLKMISELINVDLTEVQQRYKQAFEIRRDAKRELKLLQDQIMPKPDDSIFKDAGNSDKEKATVNEISKEIETAKDNISFERARLNSLYLENKKANDIKLKEHKDAYEVKLNEWLKSEEERENEIIQFNNAQQGIADLKNEAESMFQNISAMVIGTIFSDCFDFTKAKAKISEIKQPEQFKTFIPSPKPELTTLDLPDPMPSDKTLKELEENLSLLEAKLFEANEVLKAKESELSEINAAKQVYDMQMKQYVEHNKRIKEHYDNVQECEENVSKILNEIKAIIKEAKLPDDFSIDLTDKNDILFRTDADAEYLPITNETLASSAIFIAAFKLQANYLTAFKVAHFDVSYLDFENRKKVLNEAISMGIQYKLLSKLRLILMTKTKEKYFKILRTLTLLI